MIGNPNSTLIFGGIMENTLTPLFHLFETLSQLSETRG